MPFRIYNGIGEEVTGKEVNASFPCPFQEDGMDFAEVLRYTILAVSAGAMLVGVLVMAGVLVSAQIPDRFGMIAGAVIFLYGAYRFALAYFKKGDSRRHGL